MKTFASTMLLVSVLILSMSSDVRAANADKYDSQATQWFSEATALCEADGGKLWGVSLCAPILLVDPQSRKVIANRADNEGRLTQTGTVFIGTLPSKVNIANTAMSWAGMKWTMVMLPLPEDRHQRAALIAHELWHHAQDNIGLPSTSAANNHLDSLEGRVWLQLEWRALIGALQSKDGPQRQAIADALLFRAYRRTFFPNAGREEAEMELHEGLAEYTGVKLSRAPDVARVAAQASLSIAPFKPSLVRSFAYASGPAYGLLLDDTGDGWRKTLRKGDDLGALLQQRLAIAAPVVSKAAAESRAKSYDGDSLIALETEREVRRQQLITGNRMLFVVGPVLAIPLREMNMQFDPGNLLPLDDLGTVYPQIRIVDVWGVLTVKNGALMDPNFSRITVIAPPVVNPPMVQGDGWTLELNKGWSVVPGARKHDYVLKESKQAPAKH